MVGRPQVADPAGEAEARFAGRSPPRWSGAARTRTAASEVKSGPEEPGELRLDGYSGPTRAQGRCAAHRCHPGFRRWGIHRSVVPPRYGRSMGPDHTFDAVGSADATHNAPDDAGAPDDGEVARLLDGLDPGQREAVTSPGQPVCILAGAGSGKTRVLTRRIAYRLATGSALPRHVLALTFTRRAAGELGRRLAQLGVPHQLAAGTFHAIAYAQLRRYWADRGERAPGLLDHKARVLVPLLPRRQGAAVQPADIASEIEWAKARLVRPEAYEEAVTAAGRRTPVPAALFATLDRKSTRLNSS